MSATAAWLARVEKVSEDELQRRRDVFRSMLLAQPRRWPMTLEARTPKLLCRQICQEGKGKRRPGPSSWTPLRLPFDLHAVTSVSVSTRCQSDIRGLVTSRADCFGWSGSQV